MGQQIIGKDERGVPWSPVPGRDDVRIQVAINENGDAVDKGHEQPLDLDEDEHESIQQPILRGGPDTFHVSRKAVAKHGTIDGCAACTAIRRLEHLRGRSNYNHSEECRTRIICMMRNDPEYRGLMEIHCYANSEQNIEMITDMQREEMAGHIRKAIHHINNLMERKRSPIEHGLDTAMMELLIANIQVAEVYSPPRVVAMA